MKSPRQNDWLTGLCTSIGLGLLLGMGMTACGEKAPAGSGSDKTSSSSKSADGPSAVQEWTWVQSHAGGFWCAWRPIDGPVEMGPSFPIEVRLAQTRAGEPLDIESPVVKVDARMPEHDHGMLQRVEIQTTQPGVFRVDGMRLHMVGYWELYVDLIRGPVTERAQFVVEL